MAKTRGQLEAEISDAIVRFELDYMGRGPEEARTYLVDDMVHCAAPRGAYAGRAPSRRRRRHSSGEGAHQRGAAGVDREGASAAGGHHRDVTGQGVTKSAHRYQHPFSGSGSSCSRSAGPGASSGRLERPARRGRRRSTRRTAAQPRPGAELRRRGSVLEEASSADDRGRVCRCYEARGRRPAKPPPSKQRHSDEREDAHGGYTGRGGPGPARGGGKRRQQSAKTLRDPLHGAVEAEGQGLIVGTEGLRVRPRIVGSEPRRRAHGARRRARPAAATSSG